MSALVRLLLPPASSSSAGSSCACSSWTGLCMLWILGGTDSFRSTSSSSRSSRSRSPTVSCSSVAQTWDARAPRDSSAPWIIALHSSSGYSWANLANPPINGWCLCCPWHRLLSLRAKCSVLTMKSVGFLLLMPLTARPYSHWSALTLLTSGLCSSFCTASSFHAAEVDGCSKMAILPLLTCHS